MRAARSVRVASTIRRAVSAAAPNFVVSPARSTCTRISGAAPASAAAASSFRSEIDRIDRVDAGKAAAAFLALFDCRWPMRCHLIAMSAVRRSSAGPPGLCFRRNPAGRRAGGPHAIGAERLGDGDEADGRGSRPARRAAASSRDLTDWRLARDGGVHGGRRCYLMYALNISTLTSLSSRSDRLARSSVGLEFLGRLRQLAEIQVHLSEHEMRFRVVRVGRGPRRTVPGPSRSRSRSRK